MEKNGKVTWIQLTAIIGIAITILGWLFTKLEKIDDSVGLIRTDVAVIKQQLDSKQIMSGPTSLLDRMFK